MPLCRSFLVQNGFEPKSNIGLYSVNRAEWVLAEQGSYMYNICTVPLYDTLGNEAIQYIVNQSELRLIVASKDKIANLIKLKGELASLKWIVSMDPVDEELKKSATDAGCKLPLYYV